jgi:hypothetical protein
MGLTRPRAAQIYDLDYKQATRVITVANVTLTGGAPAVVDGVSLVLNDRVLVTGQTTASQNGLYDVTVVGVGSDGTWERTSDGNATGEILAGMIVMVTEGALYADTQWKLTTDNPIVIGTTGLTFVINILSSVGGANTQVQVNDGGTLAGFSNFVFDKTSNILSVTGNISATGNVNGNYILGNGSQLSGIITTVDANTLIGNTLSSNIVNSSLTSTGTLGSLSVTGNITGGNITIPGTANISTFIGNTFFGSVPAQPTYYNIAPLNLNNSLSAATKVQLNLINTGGGAGAGSAIDFYTYQISVAAANAESRIAAIDDGNYSAYLSLQTKTPGSTGTNGLVERVKVDSTGASVVGNVTGGNILTGGTVSATGNIQGGNLRTAGLISATGTVTGTSFIGVATSAQYADLAENYLADAAYAPGTVVEFGGNNEVTVSTVDHSTAVAGVVSTDPAYLMNSDLQGVYIVAVALTGRVPCLVQGPVKKGSVLVSGTVPGTAMSIDNLKFKPGCVVGKAMETIDSTDLKTIEVAVGRL